MTCRRWGNEPLRPPMAGTSPFRGGFAGNGAKRLPRQRELSDMRLTEGKPFCWETHSCGGKSISSTIRCRGWFPSFCGRRRGVAAKPPQVSVSCLSGTTKGLCDRPLETFARSPLKLCGIQRWQVAAALSAAVTATEFIGDTPNLQAEPTMKRGSTQTPAAFRKGARGRGLSQKGRLPRKFRMSPISSYSSEEGVWGRGASLREAASPQKFPRNHSLPYCPCLALRLELEHVSEDALLLLEGGGGALLDYRAVL